VLIRIDRYLKRQVGVRIRVPLKDLEEWIDAQLSDTPLMMQSKGRRFRGLVVNIMVKAPINGRIVIMADVLPVGRIRRYVS
jgi:hypothetical protein